MICGTTSLTEQERRGGHWKKWRATWGYCQAMSSSDYLVNHFEIHSKFMWREEEVEMNHMLCMDMDTVSQRQDRLLVMLEKSLLTKGTMFPL